MFAGELLGLKLGDDMRYLFCILIALSLAVDSYAGQILRGSNSGGSGEPPVLVLTKLAHTTGTATGSATISINVPTVYDGNLLTLSVVNDDGGAITTPGGWTLVESVVASSSRHSMFSRVASSEPANYTITNGVSGDLVAVMTSWQKPSGTVWRTIVSGMIYRSTAVAATPYMQPVNGSVMYVAWPNDAGYSIVSGPYTGNSGTTPATKMVSIGRITASSLSIDTYYEPSNAGANVQRYVEFSAAEDSGVGFMVLSYE